MDKRYEIINDKLNSLSKSTFRNSFYLKDKDKNYIKDKGMNIIKDHAYDIILKRLAPIDIKNDGKQTPMRGHPVFIAQHAAGDVYLNGMVFRRIENYLITRLIILLC